MQKENLPTTGDVITSPLFAYGYYQNQQDKDRGLVYVDGVPGSHQVRSFFSEDERVDLAARTGEIPPKEKIEDRSAHDPSRGEAKFVVEQAFMETSGGQGQGCGDSFNESSWSVRARRLKADGSYDPKGEVISFYLGGGFYRALDPKKVQIVGSLKMKFV